MAENRYELNKQRAISFHPELDGDNRLHQYFVQMVSSLEKVTCSFSVLWSVSFLASAISN